MYKIIAAWINGDMEIIDSAESKKEAEFMVCEYSLAYGEAAKEIFYVVDHGE